MGENNVDIFEKYGSEITSIINLLEDLKSGRIAEIDNVPGIKKCSTLAKSLETEIIGLLNKLNDNANSISDEVGKSIKNCMK